jgi:hypothetical protein
MFDGMIVAALIAAALEMSVASNTRRRALETRLIRHGGPWHTVVVRDARTDG